jgi:elongator complex protein 3
MAGPLTPTPLDPESLHRRKLEWVKAGHPGPVPTNVDWIRQLPASERATLGEGVRRKPTRTLSGVAVVAVMTSPARCPHGRCTYCPGGADLGTPQSYTGEEPSALRGAQFGYDARRITENRLSTLETIGHSTSKVEAIVMGGTFTSRPVPYQEGVFRGVFEGINARDSPSLADAQRVNETAERRLVSLTIETRPDWCDAPTLDRLLDAGVTRIEIGVECLRDEVLASVHRAHDVSAVVGATRRAKDRGLKVCYHMMPGLPGMSPATDLEDLRRLFDDPDLRPDMVKLYPTLVLPGTPLFEDWKAGRFTPYDAETSVDLLARAKAEFPGWVRVQRIQRDIPARLIAAGVRHGNLREMVRARLNEMGARCHCLRCREPGRRALPAPEAFELTTARYDAAGGSEWFLAFEDPSTDTVVGFCRLRFPGPPRDGGLDGPVIRELKVLGAEVPVGASGEGRGQYQHRGFGRALLDRAEAVAREAGFSQVYVTSAVGTREYYRRLGYVAVGPHLAKPLFS